jgi:hypothetical protein
MTEMKSKTVFLSAVLALLILFFAIAVYAAKAQTDGGDANFSNLEIVLATTLSCIGLYFAYRGLRLKIGGMKVRGSYTQTSSIECEDDYISRVMLENLRDRAITIFAIYLKFGHNYYLEIEDFEESPHILGAFETFQREYGPLEFYSGGTERFRIDRLFKDNRVKKRLVLSTSDGKYTVQRSIPIWNPVFEFFQNYMTGILRPVRSTFKGKAYGSNAIYLVELRYADDISQALPIYPRDYEGRRFRRFRLRPESLESRDALDTFVNSQREMGNLPVESLTVHDLRSLREELFESDFKKTIEAEPAGFLKYYVIGWIYTRISNWRTRLRNKRIFKRSR